MTVWLLLLNSNCIVLVLVGPDVASTICPALVAWASSPAPGMKPAAMPGHRQKPASLARHMDVGVHPHVQTLLREALLLEGLAEHLRDVAFGGLAWNDMGLQIGAIEWGGTIGIVTPHPGTGGHPDTEADTYGFAEHDVFPESTYLAAWRSRARTNP
ncbi:hypothetical protein [Burkholderia glumae]